MAKTPTSPQKNNKHKFKQGMTLIEVLLVFSLIAVMAGLFIPNLMKVFRISAHSAVKNFGSLVKYTYDLAVFSGKMHRILIDFDQQTWTIERASSGDLPLEDAQAAMALESDDRKEEKEEKAKKNENVSNGYEKVEGRYVPLLPAGIEIVEFSSWRFAGSDKKPITSGLASIYIFPSGYVDDAQVKFAERGQAKVQVFKVNIKPLTGRIRYVTEIPK